MTTLETPVDHPTAAASGVSATQRFHIAKSPLEAVKDTPTERVDILAREIRDAVHAMIRKHNVTCDENPALKLIQVGLDGEWPLFLGVSVEHAVEDVATAHRHGNTSSSDGPYYVPDAPELGAHATLPMRENEKGAPWEGKMVNNFVLDPAKN